MATYPGHICVAIGRSRTLVLLVLLARAGRSESELNQVICTFSPMDGITTRSPTSQLCSAKKMCCVTSPLLVMIFCQPCSAMSAVSWSVSYVLFCQLFLVMKLLCQLSRLFNSVLLSCYAIVQPCYVRCTISNIASLCKCCMLCQLSTYNKVNVLDKKAVECGLLW